MGESGQEYFRALILDAPVDGGGTPRVDLALHAIGTVFTVEHVYSRESFISALADFRPDVVLADYALPDYPGEEILVDARHLHPEIPLIFIADAISATQAVELIHAGVSDYVPRDQLDRLPKAVRGALAREHGIRKRKASERALREAMKRLRLFRTLLDQSTDGVEVIDPETLHFIDVNEAECRNLGYSRDELLGMSVVDIDPSFAETGNRQINQILEQIGKAGVARFEGLHRRKDGSEFPVEISAQIIQLDKPYGLSIARDISDRKHAEAEMIRLTRVLRTLNEANRTLLHSENEPDLMHDICRMFVRDGDYSLAWIGMAQDDEAKSVVPMAIAGTGVDYVENLQLSWADVPLGNGPVGKAIRNGSTQVVQDIVNDPGFSPWRAAAAAHGYASCVSLPLQTKQRVFGSLSIYSKDTAAFSASEIALLEEVAQDLAFGLINLHVRNERDQAIKEREQYTDRLRKSMEGAIQAVATVVEMRDLYTAGHQRRVAELAAAIARELGMSDEQVNGVHLAAIVHDLGKIHIPSEILSKPARLSDIEYSLVKTHSQAGYDILKGIDFPWPIALAVLQHHERMDGSGYPQGLKGDEIILEARILAVADVVDSMSSHRPYRASLGLEPALDEIRENRGVLYDPEVVDACLTLFREKKFRLPD